VGYERIGRPARGIRHATCEVRLLKDGCFGIKKTDALERRLRHPKDGCLSCRRGERKVRNCKWQMASGKQRMANDKPEEGGKRRRGSRHPASRERMLKNECGNQRTDAASRLRMRHPKEGCLKSWRGESFDLRIIITSRKMVQYTPRPGRCN